MVISSRAPLKFRWYACFFYLKRGPNAAQAVLELKDGLEQLLPASTSHHAQLIGYWELNPGSHAYQKLNHSPVCNWVTFES